MLSSLGAACPGTQQGSEVVDPWLFNIGDRGLTLSTPGYKSTAIEAVRVGYCYELLGVISVCILMFTDEGVGLVFLYYKGP